MEKKSEKESSDKEDHGRDEGEDTGEPESSALKEDADEEDGPVIKPVEKSIGEGRDNLRQRESWFRRRSGMRN
jgi:hypothetical protein